MKTKMKKGNNGELLVVNGQLPDGWVVKKFGKNNCNG